MDSPEYRNIQLMKNRGEIAASRAVIWGCVCGANVARIFGFPFRAVLADVFPMAGVPDQGFLVIDRMGRPVAVCFDLDQMRVAFRLLHVPEWD